MAADRSTSSAPPIGPKQVEGRVLVIRGEKVIVDSDLAALYAVTTSALNQAVARNRERFPADFAFQLTRAEADAYLRSQTVTSNLIVAKDGRLLKSQSVTSKVSARGGRRTLPYAFTEQGVAMLSSVLRSPRAIAVNIEIMRTFVRLRQMIASNEDLARKLTVLEKKYDKQFRAVFDAIRELMEPVAGTDREMGFHTLLPASRPTKTKD
jgi:hypothetical protein